MTFVGAPGTTPLDSKNGSKISAKSVNSVKISDLEQDEQISLRLDWSKRCDGSQGNIKKCFLYQALLDLDLDHPPFPDME